MSERGGVFMNLHIHRPYILHRFIEPSIFNYYYFFLYIKSFFGYSLFSTGSFEHVSTPRRGVARGNSRWYDRSDSEQRASPWKREFLTEGVSSVGASQRAEVKASVSVFKAEAFPFLSAVSSVKERAFNAREQETTCFADVRERLTEL